MMRRREFITLLGGLICSSDTVYAQRVAQVAVLIATRQNFFAKVLQTSLRELGWTDGYNIRFDIRSANGDIDQIKSLAKELVRLHPDVIVAHSGAAVRALREETDTTPIVFFQVADPLGAKFINSLARPGGNMTGFSNFEPSMGIVPLDVEIGEAALLALSR